MTVRGRTADHVPWNTSCNLLPADLNVIYISVFSAGYTLFVAQTHKHAFLTELLNNTFIFYVLCNYFNWLYFEWVSLQSKATVSDCRWWMHPWSPCCYATSTTLAKGHMSQFSNFLQFLVRMALSSQWSSRGEQRLLLLAAVQSVWPQDEIFSEEAAERCGKMVQKQTQKSWR